MNIDKQKYYIDILKVCLAVEKKRDLLVSLDSKDFLLDKELLNEYVECISDVFCKYGLNEDDEPNSCGFILEELIDFLYNFMYKL
jgi:hypothetical protein